MMLKSSACPEKRMAREGKRFERIAIRDRGIRTGL
jgi:hypothetical protein